VSQFQDGIEYLLELSARVARKGIVLHRHRFGFLFQRIELLGLENQNLIPS
jgi:hypothetical protein